MALDVLAHGRLVKAPERRTGASGKPFATAQIAVATDGDDSALVSLIAFRREVVTALLALDVGDSVALAAGRSSTPGRIARAASCAPACRSSSSRC